VIRLVIRPLGLQVGDHHVECGELRLADAPTEEVFVAILGIELPLAFPADDRDRIGLLVRPELQHDAVRRLLDHRIALAVEGEEPTALEPIDDRIARGHEPVTRIAQDGGDPVDVVGGVGDAEGLGRLLGGFEARLRSRLSFRRKPRGTGERRCRQQDPRASAPRWPSPFHDAVTPSQYRHTIPVTGWGFERLVPSPRR
jgi:hypothetical protein